MKTLEIYRGKSTENLKRIGVKTMKQITPEQLKTGLDYLLQQWGKDYVYGVENDNNASPTSWDCSELSQSVYTLKWSEPLPDGAKYQYDYCQANGKRIYYPLSEARAGDLVFLWNKDMKSIGHVCIVFGEIFPVGGALMIEARGRPFGKVMFTPLDTFIIQFKDRMAGVYRLFETKK